MSVWLDPWHLLVTCAINRALRQFKTRLITERDTMIQPIVLKPQRQVIAGIRPFAVKMGYPTRPVKAPYGMFVKAIGQMLYELETRQNEDWEQQVAQRLASAALMLGADRFDAALFAIAKWDLPQESDRDTEDSPTQQTQVLDRPWPSNERLADGDY